MTSKYDFNPKLHQAQLVPLLTQISVSSFSDKHITKLLKQYPKSGVGFFTKNELILAYQYYQPKLNLPLSVNQFSSHFQKKPTRSLSGVTVVTTLTKPFPCPGKCIFCPSDVRMPKSYLKDEPGAQRAAKNAFDPYLQTYSRLQALSDNGHDTSKIELIILGGTWSYYPEPYQLWYIKRSLDALNDFGAGIDQRHSIILGDDFQHPPETIDGSHITKTYNQLISEELIEQSKKVSPSPNLLNSWENATWEELEVVQYQNETSSSRCVGMVIETRPDNISPQEITKLRRLGCTKTQIGIQSLSDHVLKLNHRGHTVAATRRAFKLLRQAGFKIHAHWMPNLYGSNPKKDIQDFHKLFNDPDFMPDELKIYPCSLIESAELMTYYQQGKWHPYTKPQLLKVLTQVVSTTPQYCRLTRIVRDIPGTDIVVGNKATNFRQIVDDKLAKAKVKAVDIRAREIKAESFDSRTIKLDIINYQTSISQEYFLQYVTHQNQLLAFLRLSLPMRSNASNSHPFIPELTDSAIIREIHVYGQVVGIGKDSKHKPQHLGLGKKLIQKAMTISKQAHFNHLAVISAIGTREYYRKLGFTNGKLYQHISLST